MRISSAVSKGDALDFANERVALVIPAFNGESTIIELLESIRTQTKLPDELAIVDAGSTDRTAILAREWVAAQDWAVLTKIVSVERATPGGARNIGVLKCKPPLIAVTGIRLGYRFDESGGSLPNEFKE